MITVLAIQYMREGASQIWFPMASEMQKDSSTILSIENLLFHLETYLFDDKPTLSVKTHRIDRETYFIGEKTLIFAQKPTSSNEKTSLSLKNPLYLLKNLLDWSKK